MREKLLGLFRPHCVNNREIYGMYRDAGGQVLCVTQGHVIEGERRIDNTVELYPYGQGPVIMAKAGFPQTRILHPKL